ncbi:T9SS C-terminal target domain-containing protein [Odoribacter sp. OF09-27XD]|nr:T9SS type A sorting domain-containing protein [Odoribacter sp. OF09-27XD]RHV97036.1 T9SS C-terminal target domain-containing protein [Odoribacter sp. OF09-27XD]
MTAGSIKAIDITALPAGMYVLEVEHKGAKITSKVVKQ